MDFFVIDNLDYRGNYINKPVLKDDIGYFTYKDTPFVVQRYPAAFPPEFRYERDRVRACFYSALLMSRNCYPIINPSTNSNFFFSINLIRKSNTSLQSVVNFALKILDGIIQVPIYYNDYLKYEDTQKLINYVYCYFKGINFYSYLEQMNQLYTIESIPMNMTIFDTLFKHFMVSSDMFKTALYYYIQSAKLVTYGFIEESGLNMQLSIDVIIEDYMNLSGFKNKAIAVEKLMKFTRLPTYTIEMILDQKKHRNSFLAHFDKGFFTEKRHIDNPDLYCLETFRPLSRFLVAYLNSIKKMKNII